MPYGRATPAQRTYNSFPAPVTGYQIDGRWEIVEPVGVSVVNLVANPSVELNSTGYSAQGAAVIARDSTRQRRGVYALKVTSTSAQLDGTYYDSVPLIGQSTYTLSFDFLGAGGIRYRFYMASNANNAISPVKSVMATGGWQRVDITFREPFTAGAPIARRIYVTKDYSTSVAPFWIDGLSVVALPYPVTYFDGDNIGFIAGRNDFLWNGTRHASTSTMMNYTRAGGKVTPLSKYGLSILALIGLGMQPLNNISTPQALIGGSVYQRTVSMDRVFDIAGNITGRSLSEVQARRRDLLNALKPNATPTDSPLLLLYTPVDDCGEAIGETLEIPCVYESGLEGNITNHYQEPLDLRFHSFLPFLAASAGEHGQVLGYQQVLPSGYAFIRDTLGNWRRMGTGLNADINQILELPNGKILLVGRFTDADGDAGADYVAYYDYDTNRFTAVNSTPLSGGTPTTVRAAALLPDGNRVLIGGAFLNAGGVAAADYLCILNLTTGVYSAVNLTPLNAPVYTITVLNNGDIVIGGEFTNAGGADGDYFTKINGSTFAFEALNANPLDSFVLHSSKLFNGDVVFGGTFLSASGVSNVQKAGYLNATTGAYSALNTTPLSNNVFWTTVGLDGAVYLGGEDGIMLWVGPGAPFQDLGAGTNDDVLNVITAPSGDIVIGGRFTTAGGLTLPSRMAGWNGSSYYAIDLAGPSGVNTDPTNAFMQDGKFISSVANVAITGPSAYVNTIINNGPYDAYPIFEMLGPGSVYQIKNYTTGEALYLNLILNSGERAILDLTPGRITFASNFRPNLLGNILPGSALATFRLIPGSNAISVFIVGNVNISTSIAAKWRDFHWGIDSAVYTP